MKIAVIVGSTRPGRVGDQVGQWVMQQAAGREGATYELIDLAEVGLPLLDEPIPAAAGRYANGHTQAWSERIAGYDGYVFVTAEYNHGVPAAFKNAFDFLYAEWNDKAVGFVGYGADGGVRAVENWRTIVANAQMADVRAVVALSLFTDFSGGQFTPGERRAGELADVFAQVEAWSGALAPLRG
ncbi:MAG: NAD(P)H-dependent oxidoreductase [Austwickia sp.]|nr:NAD(P)H-dependent oxidoreductase [Actinomycetota bacterium]MCO5310446.1 NAD(P)H-dependent oxidoreductase [Austwickia sp.]